VEKHLIISRDAFFISKNIADGIFKMFNINRSKAKEYYSGVHIPNVSGT